MEENILLKIVEAKNSLLEALLESFDEEGNCSTANKTVEEQNVSEKKLAENMDGIKLMYELETCKEEWKDAVKVIGLDKMMLLRQNRKKLNPVDLQRIYVLSKVESYSYVELEIKETVKGYKEQASEDTDKILLSQTFKRIKDITGLDKSEALLSSASFIGEKGEEEINEFFNLCKESLTRYRGSNADTNS